MKPKNLNHLIYLMRLSLGQLLLAVILCNLTFATDLKGQKSKSVFDVDLEIQAKNKSILDIFKSIESTTTFRFAVNKTILKTKPKVTINEVTLGNALYSISQQARLNFRQVNEVIVVMEPKNKPRKPVEVFLFD